MIYYRVITDRHLISYTNEDEAKEFAKELKEKYDDIEVRIITKEVNQNQNQYINKLN